MSAARATANGLSYRATGDGDAPAMLFVHGFLGNADDWLHIAGKLTDRFRCIMIDLPGHGGTPIKDDTTIASAADDLADFLEALDIPAAHVVGYSLGGRIALALAARHPERVMALVLESASPGIADPDERATRCALDDTRARELEKIGLDAFVHTWYEQPLFESLRRNPERLESLIESRRDGDPAALARALRRFSPGRQAPLWDTLSNLKMPVTLITGALDAKFCDIARDMCAHNARFTHHVVADAGHAVHIEREPEFIHLLRGVVRACA